MDFDNPSRLDLLIHSLANRLLAPHAHAPFARRLGLTGTERVLEFGCGGGPMSPYLAEQLPNGHLTCLDTSKAWLARARERCVEYEDVEFVGEDICEDGVAPGPFDAIVVHLMLHDIPAAGRPPIVQALAERLVEGGRLHIKEPTKDSHGMPASEIDQLMVTAGLRKLSQERSSSLFTGPLYYGVYQS